MTANDKSDIWEAPRLPRLYPIFVDRDQQIQIILDALRPDSRISLVLVEGPRGIGKTSLTSEIARQCWTEKVFRKIVWVRVRDNFLTANRIVWQSNIRRSFGEVLSAIADEFGHYHAADQSSRQDWQTIYYLLAQQPTLLCLDNLEALSDSELDIFADFLRCPPTTLKCLVTSGKRLDIDGALPIQLGPLGREHAINFIRYMAIHYGLEITNSHMRKVCDVTYGNPGAMGWLMALVGRSGLSIEDALNKALRESQDNFLSFCFDETVKTLDQSVRRLLLILARIPKPLSPDGIQKIAKMPSTELREGLQKLSQLFLVYSDSLGQYWLAPLPGAYVKDLADSLGYGRLDYVDHSYFERPFWRSKISAQFLGLTCPVTRQPLKLGGEIVVCGNCFTVYSAAGWEYVEECPVCAQSYEEVTGKWSQER